MLGGIIEGEQQGIVNYGPADDQGVTDEQKTDTQYDTSTKEKEPRDSKNVQKRINQLVGEKKAAQSENVKLSQKIEYLTRSMEEVKENQKRQISTADEQKYAEQKADLERRINEAFENGDRELHTQTQQELVGMMEVRSQSRNKEAASSSSDNGNHNEADIADFKIYNPWFGVDPDKTAKAMEIDANMKANPNYNSLNNKEFLAEVSRQVNTYFSTVNTDNQNIGISGGVEGDAAPPIQGSSDDKIANLSNDQKRYIISRNKNTNLKTDTEILKDFVQYM